VSRPRLIFAQWPAVQYQGQVLTDLRATSRLVSFWFSRDMTSDDFQSFCLTGMAYEGKERRKRKAAEDPVIDTLIHEPAGREPTPPWEDEDEIEEIKPRRGRR